MDLWEGKVTGAQKCIDEKYCVLRHRQNHSKQTLRDQPFLFVITGSSLNTIHAAKSRVPMKTNCG